MTRIALIAAVAATLSAPALADTDFAISHFNQDKDQIAERIDTSAGSNGVVVSTRNASPLSFVFDQFNDVQDNAGDLRGVAQATVISGGHSNAAADIFAQLRAESLENE
jgi:hypothetical protein